MGRNPTSLSEKQLWVLQWVQDGCSTEDRATGSEPRISARALQRRGLISISGRGAQWSAAITDAGRARLAAAHGQPNEAEVQAFISRVTAADGPVVLPEGLEAKARYERLLQMSEHSPARPKGWRLEMRTSGPWGEQRREIVLVRYFEDLVEETPVPIPERVDSYHPAVKAYIADRHTQLVSREHVTRAAHILQAIADAAPHHGLTVSTNKQAFSAADSYEMRALKRAQLVLHSDAGLYGVRITEISASTERRPPVRWDARKSEPAWLDRRRTKFVSTGILELVVEGPGMGYSGDRYRDAKTVPLEKKLPRLFRAIDVHRLYREYRDGERRREAADRQRRWEQAMTDAKSRYEEQARFDHFQQRATEWRMLIDQRELLAAIRAEAAVGGHPLPDDLAAHLDFVERRLNDIDPLKHVERLLPVVPNPTPDDLKPFLGGWSARGSESFGS